ncbi:hypothetical protein [Dactylosporangium sp. NPDC006015]|uniref:hypothetical protein n=1 Tax=Dactylosporangium sp. NPDC006015 TaxID=3154576 RepID=UPI0033B5D1AE
MPTIEVNDHTFSELHRLATARGITPAEMIDRLIDNLIHRTDEIPLHAIVGDVPTEATYFLTDGTLRITAGPFAGHTFTRPGLARDAVCSMALPRDRDRGDGWDFWIITDTGEPLSSMRDTITSPGWGDRRVR